MFGYIKPFQPELRVREAAQYRSAYCGLCHTLSERYGAMARMLVNYDFVLAVLLFWQSTGDTVKRRCVRHPFRKQCVICGDPALAYAADALMIFTDWKLRDTIIDGKAALPARLLRLLYGKAFRKAAQQLPYESTQCALWMDGLRRIETGQDIDHPADVVLPPVSAFGSMLACLGAFYGDGGDRRAASALFTHLGHWIYLADALDDQARDRKTGAYNAITAYGLSQEAVFDRLAQEQEQALAAYDLLPENVFSEITRNILSQGLHARGHSLFEKTRTPAAKTGKEGRL